VLNPEIKQEGGVQKKGGDVQVSTDEKNFPSLA